VTLAIVVPYFKLTFFEATLESLANQTDKRFKVYIGDDASPENPSSLLEQYKESINFKYKRFYNSIGSISLVKQWEHCMTMVQEEEWMRETLNSFKNEPVGILSLTNRTSLKTESKLLFYIKNVLFIKFFNKRKYRRIFYNFKGMPNKMIQKY
jgi:glycosyltransferase involved in cell wall biosynthesis